jgi:hypothetical protein
LQFWAQGDSILDLTSPQMSSRHLLPGPIVPHR